MTTAEIYSAAKKLREDAQALCKATAEAAFAESSKSLFETFPDLYSFSYEQWTPYFNDGDPCVFHANTDYPKITLQNEFDRGEDGVEVEDWSITYGRKQGRELSRHEVIGEKVVEFLTMFHEDELLEMFGDNMRVVVRRGEIEVEEYSDHD